MKLPPQGWATGPEGARLLAALEVAEGATRMVGGAVRDALLGRTADDIDLATKFTPDIVIGRAEAAGLRAIPTGIAHGTVTVIADGRPFEVTTLRRDISTDGRHAVVAFTDDWREDAARRDFTMNALYADAVSGALFDYWGGLDDLAARRVRFIGDPLSRIAEDHLRILRFFRFHARFGGIEPDAEALAACTARANDLMTLSRERVRDEILKLLGVASPVPTVRLMLANGIFKPVLPEVENVEALERLVGAEAAGAAPAALRRLAALLPEDAATRDAVGHRLRLSTQERKRLVSSAVPPEPFPASIRQLAYRAGNDVASDLWLLSGRDPVALKELDEWERPRLPISGGELIAAGMEPGPAVARRLRDIEERWVESEFTLSRAALLRRGDQDEC